MNAPLLLYTLTINLFFVTGSCNTNALSVGLGLMVILSGAGGNALSPGATLAP
jgi:hypothetical protein